MRSMKTRLVRTLPTFNGGRFTFGSGSAAFVLDDPENRQCSEPVRAKGYYEREAGNSSADDHMLWLFRNRLVIIEPPYEVSYEELALTVKHLVLSQEKTFADMQRDVERFERLEEATATPREPIPAEVRVFVWRRDQGRCVRCASNERLEYDHIIPLAKGGSNTERNIQLLCESCNRAKGCAMA
jgi:HNH endonuclease